MPDETGSNWSVQQFNPDTDVPRLVTLLNETEAVDQEGNEAHEQDIREMLGWPGHDPAHDRFVVEEPAHPHHLIGYGLLWKLPHEERGELSISVHPDWRQRGIGKTILASVLARAHELHAAELGAYANIHTPAGGALLRRYGFEPVSAYTALRMVGSQTIQAPSWPAGYTLRHYQEETDFPVYLEAMNRCYAGLWGHHRVTEEEARQWFPTFSHDGLFLLFDDAGNVTGTCRAEISGQLSAKHGQPVGLIDAPGVSAEHREDNLYLPLLQAALVWLQQKQPAHIEMESWGDAPATLAQYQQLGFSITRREDSYRLELNSAK